MGVLIISAVTTGFLWAVRTSTIETAVAAGAITAFVVVMALILESLATSAEKEFDTLVTLLKANSDRTIADIVISDEKLGEIVRINDMLTAQNTDFRGRLLSERVQEQDAVRRSKPDEGSFPLDGPMP